MSPERNQEFLEMTVGSMAGAGKIQDECGTVSIKSLEMFICFKVEIPHLGNYLNEIIINAEKILAINMLITLLCVIRKIGNNLTNDKVNDPKK